MKLKIILAQLDFCVGDLTTNLQKHIDAIKQARKTSADLIVFPELSLIAYLAEDLLLRQAFLDRVQQALEALIEHTQDITCVIGHPLQQDGKLYNACSVFQNGQLIARYTKHQLPNYGVFDERRYFSPGQTHCIFTIKEISIGLVICEDLWFPEPIQTTVAKGARVILVPNASPFEVNKLARRTDIIKKQALQHHIPFLYTNLVGGQDDLLFDGGSMAIDTDGNICALAPFFKEVMQSVELNGDILPYRIAKQEIIIPTIEQLIYDGLVLALKDYVHKNNFTDVVLGVSGGIDSALTLAIAVDALGAQHVHGVLMPSRFTADISNQDALELINNLGVEHQTISIEPMFKEFLTVLQPLFANTQSDVTEENIQARCRAIILMALSNKFSYLVLSTGNRSEIAVGYCTLYGDMAGGFAVLKDIPKTLVYKLAQYRNTIKPVIPQRTIQRAPTAELAPNQTDQDSLPPYAILDDIIHRYITEQQSIEDIITATGFEEALVKKVVKLIRQNEYKRRQGAIGPRINHKAFSRDRRYPITNGFRD